jgi:spermidine/putrescine transport system permease protein
VAPSLGHAGDHCRRADVFTVSLNTFGVTFFTIGSQGTLPMYIWAQTESGVKPTLNALGTLLIVGSVALLLCAQALLRRKA